MTGTLILVVGPSGVGKDTLLAGARERLDAQSYVFPRRLITRPQDAGGEDHIAVTPDDFSRHEEERAFSLSWSAHGQSYGVPATIVDHLATDRHVVVNVSRSVVDEARTRFTRVGVVAISAPSMALEARLNARGREDPASIASRLDRAAAFDMTGDDVIAVMNDGTPEQGIARFIAALETLSAS